MSVEAFRWAKAQEGLSGSEKSILLNLADRHNPAKGYAWPSHARISRDTGWSRRTVIRAIAVLRKRGLVVVRKQVFEVDGTPGPNRYYFPMLGRIPSEGTVFKIAGEFDQHGGWIES